jgi:sugar phosphate permease
MLSTGAIPRGRVHYAWIVAAVTFLTLIVSAGIRSTPGGLILPLERDFGWNRATLSLAVSINLVFYGLLGPFGAMLMNKWGARRIMVGALLLLAAGTGLTVTMRTSWQFALLWGVLVGIGSGSAAPVLGAWVSNRWFAERRGLVLGVLTASTATGQLLFLPVLAHLVTRDGWRSASLVIAAAALVAVPVVAFFMRDDPKDVGLRPFGAPPEGAPSSGSGAVPAASALQALGRGVRSRDFWLLAGSFYICGASTNGLIGTHFIPACVEFGIPAVTAAGLLAAMGVFDLVGTTMSGWLSDRWNSRYLLCWYYGLRGLSLLLLPVVFGAQILFLPAGIAAVGSSFVGLAVFAVFYGLDWVATVPPTVRLTADIFGKQNAAVMFGWIFTAHQLGAATAALGAGAVHTWLGNYGMAFLTSGLLCLLAAGLVLRIGYAKPSSAGTLVRAEVGASV